MITEASIQERLDDPGRQSGVGPIERVACWAMPTAAAFGSAWPVFGSLFAFRLIVLLLALLMWPRLVAGGREGTWSLERFTIAVFAVWLVWGAALLLVSWTAPGQAEWMSVAIGSLLVMVMCLIDSPSRCFETLRQGWIAAYLLTGIIAVREIVWGVHQSNYFIGVGGAVWDTGIASTFANPNNYAVALIISFVIFLTGLAQARARWSRVLYGVLLLSVAPLMFATNSRLGLVLLVAMALILARGWVSFASVIGGFALAVVISGLDILSTSFVSKHIDSFSWGSMSLASDQSFQVRKEMTLVGLRAVAESKMTGLGPGAFEDYAASHAQQGGSGAVNPHFGVIEILSQYGPVVAALVGALLVWLTIRGWRFWRQHSRTRVGTSFGGGLSVLSGAAPILSAFNSGYLEPSTTWIYLATILLWARVLPELGEGAINGDRPRQAAATGTRGRFSSA